MVRAEEEHAAPVAQYNLDDIDTAKSALDLGLAMCGESRYGQQKHAEDMYAAEPAYSLPALHAWNISCPCVDRWGEALDIFEKALTLPGTGLKRFRWADRHRFCPPMTPLQLTSTDSSSPC